MSVEIIVAATSALATAIAASLSALAKRGNISDFASAILRVLDRAYRAPLLGPGLKGCSGFKSEELDDGLSVRLQEVRQAMRRQHSLAITYRIASSFLSFGQFVVGGLLASSFLQDKLSKEVVGIIGLLVLASSLLRQHYRPDVQFVGAVQREARLRALIRQAEDHLFSRSEGDPEAPSVADIRTQLSAGLTFIEDAEVRDVESLLSTSGSAPLKKSNAKRTPKGA